MPLAPGTRVGSYEILSSVGAGGMGEVYRARDPQLKREVALKVLAETVAGDADRLARFRREAQVLDKRAISFGIRDAVERKPAPALK